MSFHHFVGVGEWLLLLYSSCERKWRSRGIGTRSQAIRHTLTLKWGDIFVFYWRWNCDKLFLLLLSWLLLHSKRLADRGNIWCCSHCWGWCSCGWRSSATTAEKVSQHISRVLLLLLGAFCCVIVIVFVSEDSKWISGGALLLLLLFVSTRDWRCTWGEFKEFIACTNCTVFRAQTVQTSTHSTRLLLLDIVCDWCVSTSTIVLYVSNWGKSYSNTIVESPWRLS